MAKALPRIFALAILLILLALLVPSSTPVAIGECRAQAALTACVKGGAAP